MTRPLLDAADRPKGEIAHRLDAPEHALDLAGLMRIWFRQRATWRLKGLAPLAPDPGLPGRIRGAFGVQLMAGASAEAIDGRPCPWRPACAFEALWRKQGRMDAGYDHASPWLVHLDPHAGALDVTLVVFGFATEWFPAALEAMTAALREHVDWRGDTDLFVPKIELDGRRVETLEGVALRSEPDTEVALEFLSPLAISGGDPREKPASLMSGMCLRIEALARWHDATLLPGIDRRMVASMAREMHYAWRDTQEVRWRRGSQKQDKFIPMHGLFGTLVVQDDRLLPTQILELLTLSETCSIGADIAFGCGRYRITGMNDA